MGLGKESPDAPFLVVCDDPTFVEQKRIVLAHAVSCVKVLSRQDCVAEQAVLHSDEQQRQVCPVSLDQEMSVE